jgi:hypothetical protein
MIKLYTIEIAGKSAEEFFRLLKTSWAKKIMIIRLHSQSKQSGLLIRLYLIYYTRQIAALDYQHVFDFAHPMCLGSFIWLFNKDYLPL